MVIGWSGPEITDCIPITSFGFLYRLESLQYHQNTCFCDFPIALIPATMSYSQAIAKIRGQKPGSIRVLKCTQHVLFHGGSLENEKQNVKDPANAREGVTVGPTHTDQIVILETSHTPVS